jgi:hypothetical protein
VQDVLERPLPDELRIDTSNVRRFAREWWASWNKTSNMHVIEIAT